MKKALIAIILMLLSSLHLSRTPLTHSEMKLMSSTEALLPLAGVAKIKSTNPIMKITRMPQAGAGVETLQNYIPTTSQEPMERIALSPSQYQIKTKVEIPHSIQEQKTGSNLEKSIGVKNNLLYSLVQAEAGNQDLKGCRLVADVVLNRIDDPRFPNTVEGVVYAPGQFSVVRNGALKKAQGEISEKVIQAVDMELNGDRLDTTILYFNNSNNGGWKYGGHWFK